MTFFYSPRNFSIRSVATDKLDMTVIYSKWTSILSLVNSQNRTLLQLTLDLLTFRHIEILHLAIIQIPENIVTKHCTISRYLVKMHHYFPSCFGGNQKPAYPWHYWYTSKVKSRYFSPAILAPRGNVVANDKIKCINEVWLYLCDGCNRIHGHLCWFVCINRSKCIVSFDWSIHDDRMFSSSRPIKWQYAFAAMYVHTHNKDGRAPITQIQSDFTEKTKLQ